MAYTDRSSGTRTGQLHGRPCCPPRPFPPPTDWARYPALQNVDIDGHRLEDVSGITFCDGTTLNTGTAPPPTDWAQYPATQSVDLSCNSIVDVSGIAFCDGTYIGSGNSFDISSNQVLVLSGTADPAGSYNSASIVSSDRIYQQLNSDPSWNAVNSYYELSKNVAPAVNPRSSGDKAVSTWTSRTPAAQNQWRAIAWAPEINLFAAVSRDGSNNQVMTSPDGINWTSRTTVGGIVEWRDIVWSPELRLFCAVAQSGNGTTPQVMTSSDGITWTSQTSAVRNNWRGITWAPELGLFVAVAQSGTGNRVMTSPNGINWTSQISAADIEWVDVVWAPELGLLVAIGNTGTGNRVMTSPNGINWTSRDTTGLDKGWISITWSPELGLFAAVAQPQLGDEPGNKVMTSSNGIDWTLRTSASDSTWFSITWSPQLSLFCAVSFITTGLDSNTQIMTSPDGINWTLRTSASNDNWASVEWSPELGIFCAVSQSNLGGGNRVMTSSLRGRPPTSYNVFDSSFNQIDQSGNWTIQQVLKSGTVTLSTTPTTQSVAGINLLYISNSTTTRTITNFTGAAANQRLTVIFTGTTNTIVQNSDAVRLRGGANVDASANDTLTLLSVADPILLTDCSGTSATNIIFCSSTAGLVVGMAVRWLEGTGSIPANATITSILTSPTRFTISSNLTTTLGNPLSNPPTTARLIASGRWIELSRSNNV